MKIMLLALVIILGCFLAACSETEEALKMREQPQIAQTAEKDSGGILHSDKESSMIEGYMINNNPLCDGDTSYAIEDLRAFFEKDSNLKSIDDIDSKFPITHLRSVNSEIDNSYYIAYPVTEGGKYLLFLLTTLREEDSQRELIGANTIYINDLKSENEVSAISYGSSYEDVLATVPQTIGSFARSSAAYSYSILENKKVMICKYVHDENQTLIVAEISVVSLEDSPLANMVSLDLCP